MDNESNNNQQKIPVNETEIINMICQCMPISAKLQELQAETGESYEEIKQKYVAENFFIVPTKSGKHIVCKPFNRDTFSHTPKKEELAIAYQFLGSSLYKLAKINNSRISLTSDGLLVADAISVEILNIMSR